MDNDSPAGRLDIALVERGLAPTRSRARDLISRGLVEVAGCLAAKPAMTVSRDAHIIVTGTDAFAASRGGTKLAAALDHYGFDPARRCALDIGASTGGFTELLIARGAARVYAVDVGNGQLHPRLKADPRVVSLEAQDARGLKPSNVPEPVSAIVADVSFISLSKALPAALALATHDAFLIALVKPQFEVGPAFVGKGGIVRDDAIRQQACTQFALWLAAVGWTPRPPIVSPITGGSGNVEYLIGATRHD